MEKSVGSGRCRRGVEGKKGNGEEGVYIGSEEIKGEVVEEKTVVGILEKGELSDVGSV